MEAAPPPKDAPTEPAELAARAAAVLEENDMGGWTRAAPNLYPHQWSWDSAFIAIGLAHLDVKRAATEIRSLLGHQWKTGKIPHIVFNPDAPPESYFPGPEHWASAADSPDAPSSPARTSGLCQPPVHAIAVRCILEVAERRGEGVAGTRGFLADVYPKLLAWHRYLATARDPEGSGLVTIFHPWESGTDNSPRWSAALERVEVGEMPGYARLDLGHVPDPSERPTNLEYDRFIWLVEVNKRAGCDAAVLYDTSPFLVKDVLASAILVRANEALLEIAENVGAPDGDRATICDWIESGRRGLDERWEPRLGLCLDYDLRAGKPLEARTIAGFAPLIACTVVDVGRRVPHRERDAASVDHNVALRALFAAIRRVRAGLFAPPGAGTAAESKEALPQSMRLASPRRSSRVSCKRAHTPASCHSFRRRQQVMPEPQPISWGSISQGMPVLSTNRTPVRAARSSTRGLPPLGLGGRGGKSGSTTAHSSSVTSGFGMAPSYPKGRFC